MSRSRSSDLVSNAAVWGMGLLTVVMSSAARAEPANATAVSPTPTKNVSAPLSQRFADAETEAVPDFQKHVVPLMGRLGCNGRACHGSFQGRGGFQLSLFGYDFKGDYQALLEEQTGRVEVDEVEESLILAKPTDADAHEGGKRYEKGSWQYHVIRRWIEAGADFDRKPQRLSRLEVVPNEIQFKRDGEQVALRAVAHWEDGTAEDVTELCRFSSNDDAIADISETGEIESGQTGDTHVVVYYDNAVVPVPVLRPVTKPSASGPAPTQPVDRLVQQKLDKLGITPSGICTDAEFIRRASLDITGILPTGSRVREFLADNAADKRARLIDELLDTPGYSAWWATRFSDWTGNSEEQLNNVLPVRGAATRIWHEWLRARLEDNVPYDEIVAGIVTAESREPNEGYLDFCESMAKACKPGHESEFAKRSGMPLYWGRRNFVKPEDRAIGFAYSFLAVRIECAQCHKHPFDQWSKDDFEQFAKLFAPFRLSQNTVTKESKEDYDALVEKLTDGKKLRGGDLRRKIQEASKKGEAIPFGELTVTINTRAIAQRKKAIAAAKKRGKKAPAVQLPEGKILGSGQPLALDKDPREDLMAWLRDPSNPYFAKAIVNRVWSNYFGAGIVDPTDDMNLANPPSNAPLLDHLSQEFVAQGYDLKWLHRTILNSKTYQRSADTNETNAADRVNFSHHIPRRLPAEVVYDSIALATGSDRAADKLREEVDQMAIADGKPKGRNRQEFALSVFGQSSRDSNCDCDRSSSPSLLQSIYLRNDAEMHSRLAAKDGWVAQACDALGVKGPKGAQADPKQLALQRRADGYRRQFLGRLKQYRSAAEPRREKLLANLEREHKNATKRFEQMGFSVPPLQQLLDKPGSWGELEPLRSAARGEVTDQTVQAVVEDAYLRTLSRFPDAEETEIAVSFIEESETPAAGVQSLLWALVNTKEFIITH